MVNIHSPSPTNYRHPSAICSILLWSSCLLCSVGIFLLPALWNGFPIVFFDSGGYVKAAMEMKLVPGRSLFYGLFLWGSSMGWRFLWSPLIFQTIFTIWLIYLTLRCCDLPTDPKFISAFCIGLGSLTGISWYTAQLMPDILLPLEVLALWLLGFCSNKMRRLERIGVMLLAMLGLLSHMSCMALGIGLTVTIAVLRLMFRKSSLKINLLFPSCLVLFSIIVMPLLHLTLTGKASFTPGGPMFLLGRLVQAGIAPRWLAEHCPVPGMELCDLQHRFPLTGDDFLWGGTSPFLEIGGWDHADETEIKYLVRESIMSYPGQFLWSSLRATGQQLLQVATGEGVCEFQEGNMCIFGDRLPGSAKAFFSARQQDKPLEQSLFDGLNIIHVPIGLFSEFFLIIITLWGVQTKRYDCAVLAGFVFIALIGNAFISGALSNPHNRYQSRMIWLAPLILGITFVRWSKDRSCKKIA
jgi:hypothetical protein